MQHSAPRLEVAANNACTVTAQLVLAALEVSQDSGTGDSVQVDLEERSEVRQGEGRGGHPLNGGEWRVKIGWEEQMNLVKGSGGRNGM